MSIALRSAAARVLLLLLLAGCEVVADFDPDQLEGQRTAQPTPIPGIDGSTPIVPDGSVRSDASIVRPSEDRDAALGIDGGLVLDAGARDAAEPPDADTITDGASGSVDASGLDASL